MPAILTHDFFGRDVYAGLSQAIGESKDCRDAFLLGNQGPDPLFYLVGAPGAARLTKLGSLMHDELPAEQLVAFKESLRFFEGEERAIAHAYALGFLCHYTLDSTMHPLVFAEEYALCDAGVDGLTRKNGGEVHGVIETELDEVVLFTKLARTVADYPPHIHVLKGSRRVLHVISLMYVHMAGRVFGMAIPDNLYARAVKSFRRVQHLFYSPGAAKRAALAGLEERFRPYSLYRAMSHRVRTDTVCDFDNHEHAVWYDPATGEPHTESFWDLYDEALERAAANVAAFDGEPFAPATAERITRGLDFSGRPLACADDPAEAAGPVGDAACQNACEGGARHGHAGHPEPDEPEAS